jgi:hypothetical protein
METNISSLININLIIFFVNDILIDTKLTELKKKINEKCNNLRQSL